jgi:Flp pilus assembly protein TadG
VQFVPGLNAVRKESGQIMVLFILLLPLLILFTGFGIDFGFGFLTKAELAKASDATALAVMRNLGGGQTTATAIGQSVFALNYNANGTLNASAPSVSITYSTDSYGDPIVNVSATAKIHTFFIGLAGFHTLTAASSSQATRPPIILSLVLDKSGSMNLNGGATALPPAVTDFLGYFIESTDRLGEISFSSIATQDVAISKTFQTPIENSLKRMAFGGATYAQGGLLDAQTQVTGVSNPPPNAVQVVVFFTDGWANTNQDTLSCGGGRGGGKTLVNYGGCSPVEQAVGWCNGISFMSPTNGSTVSCNASTFTPQDPGLSNSLNLSNISTDAKYRAVQLANTMRAQGITVYAVGLGDKIDETYLQELANDPASPDYNANEPSGLAEFAPTASELDRAFQTIASKILLRLTQ